MLVGSVVPMVVEQSGVYERSFDIYSRLLRERIVFLGQEVNDDIANLIAAQLLFLDAEKPGEDIYLYVNSPGGSAYAGMAIYDAMQYVGSDVSTVCLGMGMSAGAMILCGGAAGKRFALPNAKIFDMTKRMAEIISRHSGKDVDQVLRDIRPRPVHVTGGGDRVRPDRCDHGSTWGISRLTSGKAASAGPRTSSCAAARTRSSSRAASG